MITQRLNQDELFHLEGELLRQANALHQIWNDQQYDYFMEEYVLPVEQTIGNANTEISNAIEELYRYCYELDDI